MSDNGKQITPTNFGDMLEAALRNVIVQLETLDNRISKIEEYVRDDISAKAAAGRIISDN